MSKPKSRSNSQERGAKSSIPVSTSKKPASKISTKVETGKTDKKKSSSKSAESKIPKKESSKKSKSDISNKENKKEKRLERPKTPEEPNYEDDFEDYSDDFESDAEPEVEHSKPLKLEEKKVTPPSSVEEKRQVTPPKEVVNDFDGYTQEQDHDDDDVQSIPKSPKATTPEKANPREEVLMAPPAEPLGDTPMLRRLASRQGGRLPDPPAPPPPPPKPAQSMARVSSASSQKIDFSSASPTVDLSALADSGKRYRKLRELITLESVRHVVLDQPAVKDYDFYMELFGVAGKAQAHSQTGDDDVTEGVQTEMAEADTKWTQHPATDDFGCGTVSLAVAPTLYSEDTDMSLFRANHMHNPRLKLFVETASQVMLDLIASRQGRGQQVEAQNRSQLAFSAGYHSLSLHLIAPKCRVTCISRSHRSLRNVTIAFFIEESPADDLVGRSLVVEFALDNSQPPNRLFLSEGEIRCLTYAGDDSALFVGLRDGSMMAFDLLEAESQFQSSLPWIDSPIDLPLRTAAFDSSYLSATLSAGKTSPLVAIHMTSAKDDTMLQVSALDESGSLWIYAVHREDANTPGMRPGARLSLVLTALVRPDPVVSRSSSQPTPLIATCMAVKAQPQQQFIIGTDGGFLCSMSRSASAVYIGPRLYKSKMHVYGEITCVRLSKFDPNVLLVGLSSGCISVHLLGQPAPLVVLSPPSSSRKAVISVEWSPNVPCIFYSIHGGNRLLVWDLSLGKAPLSVNDLTTQIRSPVVTTHSWAEQSSIKENSAGIGYLALGMQDGSVECHVLEPLRAKHEGALVALLKKIDNV